MLAAAPTVGGRTGSAGFSDAEQRLCLGLALWNGRDPILKERLFGLTNSEGNHGEDVKELYYYLDATPCHSYLRMLYKYPQAAYPYQDLLDENRRRGIGAPEYELIDTGVFDEDRYFDVFIEYAQASPGEMLLRVTAHNRGADAAPLHLLPTLWFRNTWSWTYDACRDQLLTSLATARASTCTMSHSATLHVYADGQPMILFCDNESNCTASVGAPGGTPYPKDGINDFIVHGDAGCGVNPAQRGTKAAANYRSDAGWRRFGRDLACGSRGTTLDAPLRRLRRFVCHRGSREADEFYAQLQQRCGR